MIAAALLALLISVQAPAISFTVEPLSLHGDLNAVAAIDGGAVAVGEDGLIAIYRDGVRMVERPVEADLLDVACRGGLCLAVGEDGAAVLVKPGRGVYVPLRVSSQDLTGVEAYGDGFLIASEDQVMLYSPGRGVAAAFLVKGVDDLDVAGGSAYILAGGEVLTLSEDGPVRLLEARGARNLEWPWITTRSEILLAEGNSTKVLLEGGFDAVEGAGGSLLLSSGSTVYRLDVDGRLRVLAALPYEPRALAWSGGRLYAAGEGGAFMEAGEGVRLLFAPDAEYAAADADDGEAIIVGEEALTFDGETFNQLQLPEERWRDVALWGDVAAVLGEKSVTMVRGGGVEAAPYSAEGYESIELGPWGLVLAGGSLHLASPKSLRVKELAAGVKLHSASGSSTVGDEVIIVFGAGEARVIRVNATLRSVDELPCGLVAAGDDGALLAYRGRVEWFKTTGEDLTAVAVNPAGKYALIGSREGGLLIWDGLGARTLPWRAGGEVRDIAWLNEAEAIIVAGGRLYLYREEGFPEPRIVIQAPESVRLLNGTSVDVSLKAIPLYGFSGEPRILAEFRGAEGVLATLEAPKEVAPLCPAEATLHVTAADYSKGQGMVALRYPGGEGEVAVIVEAKPTPRPRQARFPWEAAAAVGAVAAGSIAAIGLLRRRPRREGGENVEEVEEW